MGATQAPAVFQQFKDLDQEIAFLHSDNASAHWSDLDLAGINEQLADFDPNFDIDLLGIEDFEVEPADKPQSDKQQKKCPHCGGEL